MELLFLGTSAGVPTRTRNVTGLALIEEAGGRWYLIDCGEGTQHRLLGTRLSLHALAGVFITHVHGDHCFGLPGLLASASMQGRKAPLDVVAPPEVETFVRTALAMSDSHLSFELRFIAVSPRLHWQSTSLCVEAFVLSHRVACHAYRFTERDPDTRLDLQRLAEDAVPRGPLWGQLARGEDAEHEGRTLRAQDYRLPGRVPRCVIVAGDNDRPALLDAACRQAQVLVHEATYTQAVADAARTDYGHSSAEQVARFAQQVNLPALVLTHFSARYQANPAYSPSIEDIRQEALASYTVGQLFLAEDYLRLHLARDGRLSRVT